MEGSLCLSKSSSIKIGIPVLWKMNSGWLIKGNNHSHMDFISEECFEEGSYII